MNLYNMKQKLFVEIKISLIKFKKIVLKIVKLHNFKITELRLIDELYKNIKLQNDFNVHYPHVNIYW